MMLDSYKTLILAYLKFISGKDGHTSIQERFPTLSIEELNNFKLKIETQGLGDVYAHGAYSFKITTLGIKVLSNPDLLDEDGNIKSETIISHQRTELAEKKTELAEEREGSTYKQFRTAIFSIIGTFLATTLSPTCNKLGERAIDYCFPDTTDRVQRIEQKIKLELEPSRLMPDTFYISNLDSVGKSPKQKPNKENKNSDKK